MTHIRIVLASGALVALAACSNVQLSPTQKLVAGIACKVDEIGQPIALPFIAGIPTIGGIAASADAAIGHPLVMKACGDLAASLGTSPASAKPIIVPSVPASAIPVS